MLNLPIGIYGFAVGCSVLGLVGFFERHKKHLAHFH